MKRILIVILISMLAGCGITQPRPVPSQLPGKITGESICDPPPVDRDCQLVDPEAVRDP